MAQITPSNQAGPAKVYLPERLSILLHGFSDAGKTLFASGVNLATHKFGDSIPGVLFGDVDGGTSTLVAKGIVVERFPADPLQRLDSVDKLRELRQYAVSRLKEDPRSLWLIALDTLTRYQEESVDTLMRESKGDAMEQRDWGKVLTQLVRICKNLPDWGCNVIVTAHTMPLMDHLERIERLMPAFQGQFRDKVASYFDVVAYLRVMYNDEGYVSHRRLFLAPHRAFLARTRLGDLLPPFIDNPALPKLLDAYQTKRTELLRLIKERYPETEIVSTHGDVTEEAGNASQT